jgi:hypothetical protein
MKTIAKITYPAFAAFAFACFQSASALTVFPINNGFEQPDLGSGCTAYQYFPSSPGWTFSGPNGSGIAANGSCFDTAGATNYNYNNGATSTAGQAAFLQGGDGILADGNISQTVTLTAGNWTLYFSLEGRPFSDGANGINVFLDGVQVGSTLYPANLGSFNDVSVYLGNLTAGSHTIAFAGNGNILGGDRTTFIDNVALATGLPANLYVTVNGTFTDSGSNGSVVEYTPAGAKTVISSISEPRGLAFDSTGNLFLGTTSTVDNHNLAKILRFNPKLKRRVVRGIPKSFSQGVTVDSLGNIFAVVNSDSPTPDTGNGTIYKFTPAGGESIFAVLPGHGEGLARDASNNIYSVVNYAAAASQILKFTPGGSQSVVATTSDATIAFTGLARTSLGNIFVATAGHPGSDKILEFTSGVESTFATGLTTPRGLAFDLLGNLYVTEYLKNGDILKFTPGGAGGVFASGINRPTYLTFGPAR